MEKKIESCQDCPFFRKRRERLQWCEATEEWRDIKNSSEVPDFCPLREGDIVLTIINT